MLRGRRSSRRDTASTTILEKKSFCWAISFELIEVAAHLSSRLRCSLHNNIGHLTRQLLAWFRYLYLIHVTTREVLLSSVMTTIWKERGTPFSSVKLTPSPHTHPPPHPPTHYTDITHCILSVLTVTAISWIFSSASWVALRIPLTMIWGCTLSSINGLHFLRISPANSTTDVVPSPTCTGGGGEHYTVRILLGMSCLWFQLAKWKWMTHTKYTIKAHTLRTIEITIMPTQQYHWQQ